MSRPFQKFPLQKLHDELKRVAFELTRSNFSQCFPPEAWRPNLNAYRFRDSIRICMDLAGIPKEEIKVQVQENRLIIQGNRLPPEPSDKTENAFHVIAMEIDYGPFQRDIVLPSAVDVDAVTARQENGYLWIVLPFKSESL